MVLRYIHLSWRARGERERDVGPIKKIITRFRGTSSSPNFDAPRSRKQTGVSLTSRMNFPFTFYLLDANTRKPCKRHYSNIADISRRPKIITVFPTFERRVFQALFFFLFYIAWLFSGDKSRTYTLYPDGNFVSPFTTNATRSLPEAVDWVISAPLSVAICHDVYKSGLILNGIKFSLSLSWSHARFAQPLLALAIPENRLSLFFILLARTHALSTILNTLTLLYQRLSLAVKPYLANCHSFSAFQRSCREVTGVNVLHTYIYIYICMYMYIYLHICFYTLYVYSTIKKIASIEPIEYPCHHHGRQWQLFSHETCDLRAAV